MLNNIKLIGIIFLSVLLLTNCKKEAKQDTTQSPGELVFAPMDANTDKNDFPVECVDGLVVTYAYVVLVDEDGGESIHTPLTFKLGTKLYTQSIKLLPGFFKIKTFELRTDLDEIVKATPMWDSDYAVFVTEALMYPYSPEFEYGFTIEEFNKIEVAIDVLCYIPAVFEEFGFVWFDITEITVREQCFFGDICIDELDVTLYGGSYYGPIIDPDEVAIFKIVVYRDIGINPLPIGEYANWSVADGYITDEFGEYIPLCVQYADYDVGVNEFQFELWIYVHDGTGFVYEKFHTWTFLDDATIVPLYDDLTGEDGVVEFVLGDCNYTGTDLQIPWLP